MSSIAISPAIPGPTTPCIMTWNGEVLVSNTSLLITASIGLYLPKPTGPCSMRFWYHMYGSSVGSLNIYKNTLDRGKSQVDSIYSSQGNKSDDPYI
jgi:hypothetical protein